MARPREPVRDPRGRVAHRGLHLPAGQEQRAGEIGAAQVRRPQVGPDEVRGQLAAQVGLAEPGETPAPELLVERFRERVLRAEVTA